MELRTSRVEDSGPLSSEASGNEADGKSALYLFARTGDVAGLGRRLAERTVQAVVNQLDDNGMSALHYAARFNQFEAAKMLLEKGRAYAAVKDEDGATPLHYCGRKKQRESTQAAVDLIHMLAFLTDVNVRDRYLSTPLHFAAMRGNEVAAKALLDCDGVAVNAQDQLGCTPLHEAITYNHVGVAALLLQHGARVDATDNAGRTCLHYVCMGENNVKLCKMIITNPGREGLTKLINAMDKDNNRALHLAIDARHTFAVKALVKRGADVNAPCRMSSTGSTPLHLAAITGDVHVIRLLLDSRAKLLARDFNNATPLHRAVEYQQEEAVTTLLSQMRTSPEQKDRESYTPLLVAACYSNFHIVEALLRMGCDIKATERKDRNALHLAAENNEAKNMQLLLRHAVTVGDPSLMNAQDSYGESPLHIAARRGHLSIAKIVMEHGADLSTKNEEEETPFLLATKSSDPEMVELFISKSEKVLNDQDEYSNSALHQAAMAGSVDVVQILIRTGADKDMRNIRMDTPMDCACAHGHVDIVEFLLDEDVSPNDEDDNKDTPLLLACRNGHLDVVKLLLERGADVRAVDKRGRNCLSLAIDRGHRSVAMVIIESSRWEEAMQHVDVINNNRDTPMRKLIRTMPDVAQVVLNRGITSSPEDVHPNDPDFWYKFNYMYLDDTYLDYNPESIQMLMEDSGDDIRACNKQFAQGRAYTSDSIRAIYNHPLMVMVTKKRDDLLSHPLVLALIRQKWNACRLLYFTYMFYYAIFLGLLTAFMLTATPPFPRNGSICPGDGTTLQTSFEKVCKYIIVTVAIVGIVTEVCQMVFERGMYLLEWLNVLDWFSYISAILVVLDFTDCLIRTEWQWQMGAFSMFASWMNFLLLVRRLPGIGIYPVMITDILKTFSKFFTVFLLFLLAFTFTFYVLLENQKTFVTPGTAIMKTWTMMLGEFTFNEVFFDTDDVVHFEGVTYAMFIFFLVVMAIVVVNLMTGLAIDDVNEMQQHAKLRKLAIQVELAITMELSMPDTVRNYLGFTICRQVLHPNREQSAFLRVADQLIDGAILNKEKIITRIRLLEGERPSEIVQLDQKLDRYINSSQAHNAATKAKLDKLENMLTALLRVHTGTGTTSRLSLTAQISPLVAQDT